MRQRGKKIALVTIVLGFSVCMGTVVTLKDRIIGEYRYWKNISEHVKILNDQINLGNITKEEYEEILGQVKEFERRRTEIVLMYPNKVVAISKGRIYIGNNIDDVEKKVTSISYVEKNPKLSTKPKDGCYVLKFNNSKQYLRLIRSRPDHSGSR